MPSDRILREPEVEATTGLHRQTRWRLEKEGKFPQRRQIGPNSIGWIESEITEWMKTRPSGVQIIAAPNRKTHVETRNNTSA